MYADGFGIRPVLREMACELAGHGYTDAFDPSGLQRHWDRLLPLLDRTLANG